MRESEPIDRDRLGVLSGALALAMALARFLESPIRPLSANVLGSPLGLNLSAGTIMLLLITSLAVSGMAGLVRSHPLARQGLPAHSFMHWLIPGLLCLVLAGWLGRIGDLGVWTAALLGSSVLIPLVFAAEYAAINPQKRADSLFQWVQAALIHLVALIAFTLVFDLRARSLFSGTAVLLLTTLLAARLVWPLAGKVSDAFHYGGVSGLILGQTTWVLNYWRLSSLRGGLALFLTFYLTAGLVQQFLQGRLDRQVALEYGGVAILAFILIWLAVP